MEEPSTVPEAPPTWVTRAVITLLVSVAALWYLRGVVTSLRPLIIMLLVSLFLSFALEPAVNRLERLGIRRGLGTALVFSVGIVALGGFGVQVGSLLAEQVTEFNENVPGYLTEVDDFLDNNFGIENATEDLRTRYDSGALASLLGDLADDLARFGSTVANVLFQLFTIGLFTFYLVAEGPKVRRLVCSFLAPHRQRLVLDVWDVAVEKTGGYILSRSLLGIISAGIHWTAFEIIGLPSALALALWVGVMSQFVPVVGTYIAGALPVLIGLLGEPIDGLSALIVVVVYQQVENYLLSPRITAHTMKIHAATAFGAVIAGAAVLGIVGALLAIPAAATIQAVVAAAAERHEVDERLLTGRLRQTGESSETLKAEDTTPKPASLETEDSADL